MVGTEESWEDLSNKFKLCLTEHRGRQVLAGAPDQQPGWDSPVNEIMEMSGEECERSKLNEDDIFSHNI